MFHVKHRKYYFYCIFFVYFDILNYTNYARYPLHSYKLIHQNIFLVFISTIHFHSRLLTFPLIIHLYVVTDAILIEIYSKIISARINYVTAAHSICSFYMFILYVHSICSFYLFILFISYSSLLLKILK